VTSPALIEGALDFATEALARQDAAALHQDLDRAVRADLVQAGTRLEVAVTELLHDDDLWARLQSLDDDVPRLLDTEQRERFSVVLSQDLGTILAALGYRPPPPLLVFRDEVLHHLGTVLIAPDAPASERAVTDARHSLIYLGHRLRALLKHSERPDLPQPPVSDLRRTVDTAANVVARIAPAVVRVGITGVVIAALGDAVGAQVVGDLAGEAASALIGLLLARVGLAGASKQVAELAEQDVHEWADLVDRAVVDIHAALSHAAIAWAAGERINIHDAAQLALANLAGARELGQDLEEYLQNWPQSGDADAAAQWQWITHHSGLAIHDLNVAVLRAWRADDDARAEAISTAIALAESLMSGQSGARDTTSTAERAAAQGEAEADDGFSWVTDVDLATGAADESATEESETEESRSQVIGAKVTREREEPLRYRQAGGRDTDG
jgi:hypothetical protein